MVPYPDPVKLLLFFFNICALFYPHHSSCADRNKDVSILSFPLFSWSVVDVSVCVTSD